jgi:hypothetical protein
VFCHTGPETPREGLSVAGRHVRRG